MLRVSNCGGEYGFEVSDTGPGIAPDLQEAMSLPFRQGSSGLARGGTGLGLSIAQRQAAQMNNVTELKRCLVDMQRLGEREARLAEALTVAVRQFDMAPVVRALEATVDG